MKIFFLCLLLLILGYIIYGYIIEKIFGIDKNKLTPAKKYADGVDYISLPPGKVFLIQFLNIAGLGPVFGAILGAVFGPVCLPWIIFGSIFAGGVHDFLTGIISVRLKGRTLVYLVEKLFGKNFKIFFLICFILALLLVGTVFATNPAKLLADITQMKYTTWLAVIFIYYFLTTILPIDKIIARFYPLFALLLITVTLSLLFKIFTSDYEIFPDFTLMNLNPRSEPVFPLLFITIACGAISGFHATQTPIMARCLSNEKHARPVFYGAMITEGVIALIWATLGISFYNSTENLSIAISSGGAGGVINEISSTLLGKIGGILTILSIILLSVTSGDTAFRSARLTIAENLHLNQKNLLSRLILSIFVLAVGISLSFIDLTVVWRYFGWANQAIATIALLAFTLYLKKKGKCYFVTLIPCLFMTAVASCYILYNNTIGFGLSYKTSLIISYFITLILLILFIRHSKNFRHCR